MDLTMAFYKLSKEFPKEESFGITSQMRRAVVSIPSNIAEGWGRKSNKSFAQFLKIARGSLYEFETQIIISERQQYLTREDSEAIQLIAEELSKMLNAFIAKIEKT